MKYKERQKVLILLIISSVLCLIGIIPLINDSKVSFSNMMFLLAWVIGVFLASTYYLKQQNVEGEK